MFSMFNSADNFNQDLSGWCVSNIPSEPSDFTTNSALTEANKPIWGTCPDGTFGGEAPTAGDGSQGNPYQISSLSNLKWISDDSNHWDKHYIQTTDINAAQTANWNDSGTSTDFIEGFNPIGDNNTFFTGSYDGQHNYIVDLYINRPTEVRVGLFGKIKDSEVVFLWLENVEVTGHKNVGGAVGIAVSSTIDEVHVYGNVKGNIAVGGVAGTAYNLSNLAWTSFEGQVTGNSGGSSESEYNQTGGLVGKLEYLSDIVESWSSGRVDGNYMVGGLVGQNAYSNIKNSYSRSNVTAEYNAVGGFIGWNQTDSSVAGVQYNYSTGTVNLTSTLQNIGGFIGYHSTCDDCSTRGNDNYWDTTSSNQANSQGGTSLVEGHTDVSAKIAAQYANWNFDSVWMISGNLNNGYPFLRGNNEIGLNNISINQANDELILVFNEPLYDDEDEDLNTQDFEFELSGANAESGVVSVGLNPTNLEISSDRKTFTLTVSLTGTFDGTEVLKVGPSDEDDDQSDNGDFEEIHLSIALNEITPDSEAPTVLLSSNDIDQTVSQNQETIIIANFSESMALTPTIQFSNDTSTNHFMSPYAYGVEVVDQQNQTSGAGAGGTDQWQSFTVTNTGRLTKVTWKMGNPVIDGEAQPIDIKIYSGLGTSGELLAISEGLFTPPYNDANGSYIGGEFVLFDVTQEKIDVTQGDVFTMQLILTSGNQNVGFLDLSTNNPYSGGKAGNDDSWDYIFKTYVRPTSSGQENWLYDWTVPEDYIPEISTTVSGTDLSGNIYLGTETLSFSLGEETTAPTVELSSNTSSPFVNLSQVVSITANFSEPVENPRIIFTDQSATSSYTMNPVSSFDFNTQWRTNAAGSVVEEPNDRGGEDRVVMGWVGNENPSHAQFNEINFNDGDENGDNISLFIEVNEYVNTITDFIKVGSHGGSNYFISSSEYNNFSTIDQLVAQVDARLLTIESQEEYDYLKSLFIN